MAEKAKKPAGKAKDAAKPAPKPTKKPAAKTVTKKTEKPAAKPAPKPAKKPAKPRDPKKPRATISIREGEYGKSARVEFPHPFYVHKILEVTKPEEQKKYQFRYFNNILVAGLYSKDLSKFLQKGAKKAGFELEVVRRR